jgi:hypothetical protein
MLHGWIVVGKLSEQISEGDVLDMLFIKTRV